MFRIRLVFETRRHRARRIEKLQALESDPLFSLGYARLIARNRLFRPRKRIDQGGLSRVGNARHHDAQRLYDAFFFVSCLFFGKRFHDVLIKPAHRSFIESGNAYRVFSLRRKRGAKPCRVAFFHKIAFAEHIDDGFILKEFFQPRIDAGKRRARIQHRNDAIHKLYVFFHHAHRLGHVPRKPLYEFQRFFSSHRSGRNSLVNFSDCSNRHASTFP